MSVFVIADLHLSHTAEKPMDIFGPRWENHTQKIKENWQNTVSATDTVVIPGDISWGMSFDSTASDLKFVDSLNGSKIIGKGNHDFWWQTMKKLGEYTEKNGIASIKYLYNNAYIADNYIICGTRGWIFGDSTTEEDEKIVQREAGRLRLSLEEGKKLKADFPEKEIIVFMHYPPAFNKAENKLFAEIFGDYGINRCYYGHLHGVREDLLESRCGKTALYCIAADRIGFKPMRI